METHTQVKKGQRGDDRWQQWTNRAFFDDKGRPARFQAIGQDITERKQAEETLKEEHRRLQQALDEVRTLRGIVPICSYCKNIRDDEGYWNQVEQYVSKHTDAKFSHGICPACFEREMKGIETSS
ncbi:MAG: PAS domain S-box protein [Syntrophales bacterium]